MAQFNRPRDTSVFTTCSNESFKEGQRMFMYSTTFDYVPQEWSSELCWDTFRPVHEIGGHGCKLKPHPGAKVPLLDRMSVTSCRQFNNKPNLDFSQNKVLAKDFKAPKAPGPPDLKVKNETSHQATFQKLSTKQIRGAKQQSMGDNDPFKYEPGITGGKSVVDRSYAQSQYWNKHGLLGLPEKVLPTHALDMNPRKLDFWVSENNRQFRSFADPAKRSRKQYAKDISNLLDGLRPVPSASTLSASSPVTGAAMSRSNSSPSALAKTT
eukprot:TRINITY_DN94745_c0_g1_i1.p1 TRINITY_DN94745_c0_g1~~TRINITY_DN94745_c0_g1_i1.p1  ORF type:complete len:267 (+),score=53.58 TRINITY_DN94745_c0_g1_i1:170-970(+)